MVFLNEQGSLQCLTKAKRPQKLSALKISHLQIGKERFALDPVAMFTTGALLSSIIAANGEEQALKWAQAIVENFARRPRGNDRSQIKAIFAGECEIALVNHYYYGKLRNSEDPEHVKWAKAVKIIIPNQGPGDRGAHINISGGGIANIQRILTKRQNFWSSWYLIRLKNYMPR